MGANKKLASLVGEKQLTVERKKKYLLISSVFIYKLSQKNVGWKYKFPLKLYACQVFPIKWCTQNINMLF